MLFAKEMAEVKPQTSTADDYGKMTTKMEELNTFDAASNTTDGSATIERSTMEFLSMDEAAVLAVLRHLDASDLINVAQTNRLLKKYAEATILSCYESSINQLQIASPNHKFFRQFGHLVRQLIVKCSEIKKADWYDKKLHILPVIADRCQKNLHSMRLQHVCEDLLTLKKADQEKVRKLFTRLKKLHIVDCCLNGWDKVTKPAPTNIELLSLQFHKMDSWQEYIRNYQELKTLHISGLFSTELLDLNPSITTLSLHAESISKNNLKSVGRLPNLRNVTIDIMGPKRDCNVIANDFRLLAEIPNLQYLYLMTTYFYPMKSNAYIATLLALQHHEKLSELHFFSQFDDPITSTNSTQFKEKAFPKLKQLSIYGDFPFIGAVSKFRSIVDIFIMESSTFHIKDFERFRSLIVAMPKLQRLFFDVTADINETCRESLVQMCQSRTSQSKLMVLIQNFENNVVQASMYPKTVLIFSVHQPTVSTKAYIFEDSVVSAFERGKLLAKKGGYVAVNYMDFAKGINSIEMKQQWN